jgi:hypothetical protein
MVTSILNLVSNFCKSSQSSENIQIFDRRSGQILGIRHHHWDWLFHYSVWFGVYFFLLSLAEIFECFISAPFKIRRGCPFPNRAVFEFLSLLTTYRKSPLFPWSSRIPFSTAISGIIDLPVQLLHSTEQLCRFWLCNNSYRIKQCLFTLHFHEPFQTGESAKLVGIQMYRRIKNVKRKIAD